MSQMKPCCFKCGAELEPDAIYCPECGRLQRSMVVRSADQNPRKAPPAPYSPPSEDQAYPFSPGRDADAEPAARHPDPTPRPPDQPDQYAQPYPEQYWREEQHADAYGERTAPAEPGEDQVYARQEYEQPYGEQGWPDSYQHGQEPAYGEQHAGYGEHASYDQQEPSYDQYGHQGTRYAQSHPQPYAEPDAYAVPEGYAEPEPAAPPAPLYGQPAAAPPAAPGPAHPAAEPVYSSSAPIPAGSLEPFAIPPPPSGGYGPLPSSNPYSPATYRPDAAYGQPRPRGPLRVIVIGAAIVLGLFLIAFVAGRVLGSRSAGPSAPSSEQAAQPSTAPTAQPTSTPAATPAATRAPTATPAQGITGNARFVRVGSEITGRCSTANGCPVTGTFKNTGGQGSGSVTFNLTDQGGSTTYGTCTAPIPVTDAGQTATASCYANGDALGQLFRSNPNATVYLQTTINGS